MFQFVFDWDFHLFKLLWLLQSFSFEVLEESKTLMENYSCYFSLSISLVFKRTPKPTWNINCKRTNKKIRLEYRGHEAINRIHVSIQQPITRHAPTTPSAIFGIHQHTEFQCRS